MRWVIICIEILIIPVLCNALDINDVYHNNKSIFYVNPAYNEIKLRIKKGNITELNVIIDTVEIAMSSVFKEETYEYFSTIAEDLKHGTSYYFIIKSDLDSLRIPAIGTYTAAPPQFTTPTGSAFVRRKPEKGR